MLRKMNKRVWSDVGGHDGSGSFCDSLWRAG